LLYGTVEEYDYLRRVDLRSMQGMGWLARGMDYESEHVWAVAEQSGHSTF
jgi:hypothetical protein